MIDRYHILYYNLIIYMFVFRISLKDKFNYETQQLENSITDNYKKFSNNKTNNTDNKTIINASLSQIKTTSTNKQYTLEDIEKESDRLETDYNKNWLKYESYHMKQVRSYSYITTYY